MGSFLNDWFSLGFSYPLNTSGTRQFNIDVDSVYPTVKITIRLVAEDRGCCIEFSEETFYAVMRHGPLASTSLINEFETEIYKNEHIKVFTQKKHNTCMIYFVDKENVQIEMQANAFKGMREKYNEYLTPGKTIYDSINKTAAKLKPVVDVIFTRMEQHELSDEEFKKFVTDIKKHMDDLRALESPHNQLPLIDPKAIYPENEYSRCTKCGCACKSFR